MAHAAPSLMPLLQPRSIAIIGASPRPGSFGAGLCAAVRSLGYAGRVYPVNPGHEEIHGMPAWPSLDAIGESVDCAAFAISDRALEKSLEQAAAAGVKAAVLFGRAHGPSSTGEPLTQRLAAIAREAGMALCGGNCMGFVNFDARLQLTGAPFDRLGEPGGISLISHSGSSWSGLIGNLRGLRFNTAISAGQELVTTLSDYISHLCDVPSTRVICCVMETVRDPENFLAALDKAASARIPIIALKLGRSEAGRAFAQSHSGALSGKAEVYDAIFERAGVISVRTLDELLDTAELFSSPRTPPTRFVALAGDSGGERQLISDLAADIQVPLASLQDSTASVLEQYLDQGNEPANPLDFWGDKGVPAMEPALKALAADANVGTVVLATNMAEGRQFLHDCSHAVRATFDATSKPVVLMGNIATTVSPAESRRLREAGIPVLMGTETGLRALKHYSAYHHSTTRGSHRADPALPAPSAQAAQWRRRLGQPQPGHSPARDGFELLESFSMPTAPWRIVTSVPDAIRFAEQVGYPVVAKIDAPDIAHKSDVGGVRLSLMDGAQLELAVLDLQKVGGPAVLLQKQLRGVELILGMSVDSQFGPVFTAGVGGIFVEILRDFAILLPQDDEAMILKKLESLRAFPMLTGARGSARADLPLLAQVISRFIRMGAALAGTVAELEINPLLVDGGSIAAVDALIILHSRNHHES